MKKGIYEKLIDVIEYDNLNDNFIIKDIDDSEVSRVLSLEFQKILRRALNLIDDKDKKILIDGLSELTNSNKPATQDEKYIGLQAYHDMRSELDNLSSNRPLTSISTTSLLTGTMNDPTLESELNREIRTSDRIDLIISFIKYSGYRLIRDALIDFTKTKKLRVITTSYMGASDFKAIDELSKLPNTEVKISYDVKHTRLHAKSYYFERETGFSTAYIGSSNISNPALTSGLEWNLKISEYTSEDAINTLKRTFETYWNDDEFELFNPNDNETRKNLKESLEFKDKDPNTMLFFDLRPYSHQRKVLEDLKVSREVNGSYRNLVVAATGTGKTMIAAFDYKDFYKTSDSNKLLFLAHRKEILDQSLYTFRNVLTDNNFGELWVGGSVPVDKTHIFGSIQTLTEGDKYKDFPEDYFDYIVIDETHHAAASTYLKILEYYKPKVLLGLTATPERMDGVDILPHFDNRIASELRLYDAINRKLLSPFHYFGVTDSIDLSHLKWSRGGYEVSELENVYTKSKQRIQIILNSLNKYLKDIYTFKGLGFCVSIKHAEFMANSFNKVGIPSIALHSGSSKEERDSAKMKLSKGEINCIFTVDLFNEGVDIPEIDTVLFLRPTESLTVFIQQLGRGLRLSEGKDALTVLDYVGQAHENYDFSHKLRALVGKTRDGIKTEIENEFPNAPAGCHISLEKIAMEYILNNIQSSKLTKHNLRRMIRNFEMNFGLELNLGNFLKSYDIDLKFFYAKHSLYELMYEVGLKKDYKVKNKKELGSSLSRVSILNSKQMLYFSKYVLTSDFIYDDMTLSEKRKLSVLYYTIWNNAPEVDFNTSFKTLKEEDPDMVKEILEILDYNLTNLDRIEITYQDKSVPLDIYANYHRDQILAAFGKSDENKKHSLREGILYIREENTDLFFITLNKNEKDYVPTTMYNDYAINSKFFNWESQSTTSIDSPTGKRYISGDPDHKVLLFVRETKKKYGNTSPYTFLGPAKIKSYKGSKPIEIIWELENSIPEKIIDESNLVLAR